MPVQYKLLVVAIILLLLNACSKAETVPPPVDPTDLPSPTTDVTKTTPTLKGTGSVIRTLLTFNDLINGTAPKIPRG